MPWRKPLGNLPRALRTLPAVTKAAVELHEGSVMDGIEALDPARLSGLRSRSDGLRERSKGSFVSCAAIVTFAIGNMRDFRDGGVLGFAHEA